MSHSRAGLLTHALFAVVALAIAAPSFAQAQTSESASATARAFFEQGLELAESSRWDEAADRFRRSLRLRPSPVVAFNLGAAYVHLGRLVEATELFRNVARDGQDELREAARARLAEVEPRLGTLTVRLEGPAEGVTIRVDGRTLPAEALGAPVPAAPGARTVRALRDERPVVEATVEVRSGEHAETVLTIPPRVPSPEETAARAPSGEERATPRAEQGGDDTALWVVVISLVVVALGAGLGIGLGVALSQAEADPVDGNLTPGTLEFGP